MSTATKQVHYLCRAREQARMEELFEKLQKKEEAIAKLELERRRGRTTPATDADSTTSNSQSTHLESPAADGSISSGLLPCIFTFRFCTIQAP